MRCTKIRAEIKQSRGGKKHGDEQIDRAEGAERVAARFSPSSPGRFYRIVCCSVKSRIIRPCAKRGIRCFHCSNWQHWLTTTGRQGHIPWTIQASLLEALRTQPFSCCDCRRTMFTCFSSCAAAATRHVIIMPASTALAARAYATPLRFSCAHTQSTPFFCKSLHFSWLKFIGYVRLPSRSLGAAEPAAR